MLAVCGDAADRAADRVVREDGRAPLNSRGGGAHGRAPVGLGGAGPALGDRSGLVAVVFGSGGGVRVDDAALVPAAEQVQVLGDVGLLKDRDNLGFGVIVLDAHADDAGAQRIILVGQVGRGRAGQRPRSLAGAVGDGLQGLGQFGVGQIGEGGGIIIRRILLKSVVGQDQILGDGGVLHGGHAVDLAVHAHGFPEVSGNGGIQIGRRRLDQFGDVHERTVGHIVGVGVQVGEQDVVIAGGVHDDVAAGIPVAPADNFHIDVDADLLLEIGVDLLEPGVIVGGHAVADGDPLNGDDLVRSRGRSRAGVAAGFTRRSRGAAAAAGCEAERHRTGQAQRDKFHVLFHGFLLWVGG